MSVAEASKPAIARWYSGHTKLNNKGKRIEKNHHHNGCNCIYCMGLP